MFSPVVDLATLPLRELTRTARRTENEIGRAAARTVGAIPDSRLRQVMGGPLRRVLLDTMFRVLPRALAGTRAHEVTTRVRCHVTGRGDGTYDIYSVEYTEGRWQTRRDGVGTPERLRPARRPGRRAELTVTVDATELVRIATGRTNAVAAFLSGKLRATGDPILAARLTGLLTAAPRAAAA